MSGFRPRIVITAVAAFAAAATFGSAAPASAGPEKSEEVTTMAAAPESVRFATFNASLNRSSEGELVSDLSTPDNQQAQTVAEIIQRTDPDVLLINEFDYVAGGQAADLFAANYLEVSQRGVDPVSYPYSFVAPSNTGIPSGFDLNHDGSIGGGDDAYGFGQFPGQYGMVVYSKYPIRTDQVRTFQHFRWQDMPAALLPDDPTTDEPGDWYSPAELAEFRLSSKSHWDLPIEIANRTVHFLVSHPTPPTFDGAEDRNGNRNHDEIRFWADYVTPGRTADYIYDDDGRTGGLRPGSRFVIAGDQNADPFDGDSVDGAIHQLLQHPRVNADLVPVSDGAVEAAEQQGGVNAEHRGPAAHDTADFAEPPGNLRVDYVLPSRGLPVADGGVFWPPSADPLSELTGSYPFPSSDHRLVWMDLRVNGRR